MIVCLMRAFVYVPLCDVLVVYDRVLYVCMFLCVMSLLCTNACCMCLCAYVRVCDVPVVHDRGLYVIDCVCHCVVFVLCMLVCCM